MTIIVKGNTLVILTKISKEEFTLKDAFAFQECMEAVCSWFKKWYIIYGKVRVATWRVRVMWVTIWYLTMNYLPKKW